MAAEDGWRDSHEMHFLFFHFFRCTAFFFHSPFPVLQALFLRISHNNYRGNALDLCAGLVKKKIKRSQILPQLDLMFLERRAARRVFGEQNFVVPQWGQNANLHLRSASRDSCRCRVFSRSVILLVL